MTPKGPATSNLMSVYHTRMLAYRNCLLAPGPDLLLDPTGVLSWMRVGQDGDPINRAILTFAATQMVQSMPVWTIRVPSRHLSSEPAKWP